MLLDAPSSLSEVEFLDVTFTAEQYGLFDSTVVTLMSAGWKQPISTGDPIYPAVIFAPTYVQHCIFERGVL